MLIANILSPVSEMKGTKSEKGKRRRRRKEEKGQEIKGVVGFQQSAKCHTHSVGSRRLFLFLKDWKCLRVFYSLPFWKILFWEKMCPISLSKWRWIFPIESDIAVITLLVLKKKNSGVTDEIIANGWIIILNGRYGRGWNRWGVAKGRECVCVQHFFFFFLI